MRTLALALIPSCLLVTSACGGGGGDGGDAGSGTFVNPTAIAIPLVGASTPYPSVITVTGLKHSTASVQVTLQGLSHDFPDDLDILLVSPSGQASLLLSDVGGAAAVTALNLTIVGSGTALPDAGPLVSGVFRATDYSPVVDSPLPVGPPGGPGPYAANFAVFTGTNPNGNWLLFVADDAGGQGGSIASGWSLSISAN